MRRCVVVALATRGEDRVLSQEGTTDDDGIMSHAIMVSLVVNAALGVGWIARVAPAPPEVWPLAAGYVDSKKLQFSRHSDHNELPFPFTPTLIAIRAEDNELNLVVYGSLEHPESWLPKGPPIVYVYPDADITVGDVVAALDRVHELAPKNTVVVTELR
jgi:hypothetical protein